MQSEARVRPSRVPCRVGFVPYVAEHRMAKFSEMGSDLIAPACFESNAQESRGVEALVDLVVRDRQLSPVSTGVTCDGPLIEGFVGGEMGPNRAVIGCDGAGDDGGVLAFRLTGRELIADGASDLWRATKHQ
jgi:hypothetical protein